MQKSTDINIPKVAIIGKPNAGKSTLINRICGKREAIVHEEPMITRDRKYYKTDWNGKNFYLIDTGGIDLKSKKKINAQVLLQAKKAIDESDVIIFVVDLRQPVSPLDEEIAAILRKLDKEIIFVGNKCDNINGSFYTEEYLKFGFGYPIKISALNGINIGDLLDEVVSKFVNLPSYTGEHDNKEAMPPPGICILGRPNTGKSTLFNTIIKDERAIVDEVEGTTRDSIDSIIKINDKDYKFIDTAGMIRKKGKGKDLEYYSELRTLEAIESSEISLVLIDSTTGEVSNQDIKIIETCVKKGLSTCVVFNKIDIVDKITLDNMIKMFELKLKFYNYIPFLKVSALTGKGIKNIIKMIDTLIEERNKIIPENKLNNLFKKLEKEDTGIYYKGKRFKIKFIKQIKTAPPVFLVFSNMDAKRKVNITRYIENNIRKNFGFIGTPIFLKFKY